VYTLPSVHTDPAPRTPAVDWNIIDSNVLR
jgi:hypothetical protein